MWRLLRYWGCSGYNSYLLMFSGFIVERTTIAVVNWNTEPASHACRWCWSVAAAAPIIIVHSYPQNVWRFVCGCHTQAIYGYWPRINERPTAADLCIAKRRVTQNMRRWHATVCYGRDWGGGEVVAHWGCWRVGMQVAFFYMNNRWTI